MQSTPTSPNLVSPQQQLELLRIEFVAAEKDLTKINDTSFLYSEEKLCELLSDATSRKHSLEPRIAALEKELDQVETRKTTELSKPKLSHFSTVEYKHCTLRHKLLQQLELLRIERDAADRECKDINNTLQQLIGVFVSQAVFGMLLGEATARKHLLEVCINAIEKELSRKAAINH